jgi:hypothetical protein
VEIASDAKLIADLEHADGGRCQGVCPRVAKARLWNFALFHQFRRVHNIRT